MNIQDSELVSLIREVFDASKNNPDHIVLSTDDPKAGKLGFCVFPFPEDEGTSFFRTHEEIRENSLVEELERTKSGKLLTRLFKNTEGRKKIAEALCKAQDFPDMWDCIDSIGELP